MREINRRTFATLAGATLLAPRALAQSPEILARTIPSTGERLAMVGLGTAQVFDTGDETTKQKADAVLRALIAGGGRLVETSSVYGEAEVVIGEVVGRAHSREKLFLATKLEAHPTSPSSSVRSPAYRQTSLTYCSFTTCEILSSRLRNSRNGKRKAFAAISASLRPVTPTSPPLKPFWRARSPISFKSTIRSTTVKRRSEFCPWRLRSKPLC